MKRRRFLQALAAASLLPGLPAHAAPWARVYKGVASPCCDQWIEHLKQNGFRVGAVTVNDMEPYKRRFGVPRELDSCHTMVVQGYVIEGHVPAREIKRLLAERPRARGLAVQGHPAGAPGVAAGTADHYAVLLFAPGMSVVYQQY
jgi:hypothetical protein